MENTSRGFWRVRAMRQVLVEHARRRNRVKRGSGVARLLSVSERTAKRDWAFARAWPCREPSDGTGPA